MLGAGPSNQEGILRRRLLLELLLPSITCRARRFVNRENHGHDQHQQTASGVDYKLNSRLAKRSGEDGEQQFDENPVVPKQAPGCA